MQKQPSVFLLETARRQLEKLSTEPCIAWLLGWRTAERIEILNVCRFLSKDGQILRTTDTPYSLEEEMSPAHCALDAFLPAGVVPLGCVAVFGDSVGMSIFTLVKSLSILSSKAISIHSPAANSISGLWCVGDLTVHINGVGCDFEHMNKVQSGFLTTHRIFKLQFSVSSRQLHALCNRWTVELTVPVFYKDAFSFADLWNQFSPLLDQIKDNHCLLLIEIGDRRKELLSSERRESLSEVFPDPNSEVSCTLLSNEGRAFECPYLQMQRSKDPQQPLIRVRGLHLRCAVLCYIPTSTSVSDIVLGHLHPSFEAKLRQCCTAFQQNTSTEEVSVLQFECDSYVVPLCVSYPFLPKSDADESSQTEVRKQLHRRFLQKEDRPIFLSVCSKDYVKPSLSSKKPVNIHEHLNAKRFPEGGMVATVLGNYEYCHYGHDDYNDEGWGCAYRSLQTVFSWFIHQHYTQLPIPSHRKIQEVLVEIGDKEGSFYGSREWIGSIEVGTVLQEMIGVSYHVVSKPAHQDVSSIARELVHHFQTQGTPVSIGGGVLAYTLLGIYFNDQTAEVELLILDPHYTGRDNVESILKGGWVAWKKPTDKAAAGGPLFIKNAHYNFMCSKRPTTV